MAPPGVENAAAAPASTPTASVTAKDALTAVSASAASSAASAPDAIAASVTGARTGDTAKPAGTEPPGATAPTTPGTGEQGQPPAAPEGTRAEAPEARIQAAVRNARTETVRQVFRELGLQAPAPAQFRETVTQLKADLGIVARLRADPRQFVRDLSQELGIVAPQAPATSAEEQEPLPDLESQDGKLQTFSKDRLAQYVKFHLDKALASMRGELAPVVDGFKEQRAEHEKAEFHRKNTEFAKQVVEDARKNLPNFVEHELEIKQRLGAMDPAWVQQVGEVAALYAAHASVMRDIVLPNYGKTAEQKVREDNARKAAASTGSVRPGGQSGGTAAPDIKNSTQLAQHMREKAAKMGIPT